MRWIYLEGLWSSSQILLGVNKDHRNWSVFCLYRGSTKLAHISCIEFTVSRARTVAEDASRHVTVTFTGRVQA